MVRQRRKETTMWEEEWNEATEEGGEERDKKGQKRNLSPSGLIILWFALRNYFKLSSKLGV